MIDRDAPADQRLDRREGLLNFLNERPSSFERLSTAELAALSDRERRAYDRARGDHLAQDIVLNHPQFMRVLETFRRADHFNRPQASDAKARRFGRRAVLVIGESGTGKTTSCLAALQHRWLELLRNRAEAPPRDSSFVYIEIPTPATPKSMIEAFLDFYNYPYSARDTLAVLQQVTIDLLIRLDVRIVVIDELQILNSGTIANGESAQVIKALYNRLHATFVFSGSELDIAGPIATSRGAQISGRSMPASLRFYELGNSGKSAGPVEQRQREVWNNLVQSFVPYLLLDGQTAEALVRISVYLHHRTRGSIGALALLLTLGAADLIDQRLPAGKERLALAQLDGITLDTETEKATGCYRSHHDHRIR
jgi:hypothetical protein